MQSLTVCNGSSKESLTLFAKQLLKAKFTRNFAVLYSELSLPLMLRLELSYRCFHAITVSY